MASVGARIRTGWSGLPPRFVPIVGITFCMWLGSSIITPTLPLYVERMGVGATGVGVAVGAYFLGRLVCILFGGPMADAFGLRAVAVVGCLVSGAASAAAGFAPTFVLLVAARVLQGAGAGLYATAALSAVVALAPPERVGRLVSTYQGLGLAGFSLGPIFGGVIGAWFGLQAPFFAFAALALTAVAVALVQLPKGLRPREVENRGDEPAATGGKTSLRALLRINAYVSVLVVTFVFYAMRGGIRNSLAPLFAEAELGMTEVGIGAMLAIGAVANVAVLAHAGGALDRAGRRPVILGSLIVTGISVAAISVVHTPWLLVAVMVVLASATGYGAVAPTTVTADVAPVDIRGTAIGLQRVVTDFGHMLGPALAGFAADHLGFRLGFAALGLAVLASVAVAVKMPETHRFMSGTSHHGRLPAIDVDGGAGGEP